MTTSITSTSDLMTVTVPEGESGQIKVSRFEITEKDLSRARMRGGRGYTPPGTYTKMTQGGILWMSDTSDEKRDHSGFVSKVRYDQGSEPLSILITGLGIGMVVNAVLQLPRVALVDVVEHNEDVINLVGPHYQELADKHGVRLNIHHGDAYDRAKVFGKGARHWDYAWHDIWPYITAGNYEGMKSLRRKYGRYVGNQDCWCAYEVKRLYDQDKRDQERYAAFRSAWTGR